MNTTIRPFLDETNFPPDKKIDIKLPIYLNEYNSIRKELNKYGLEIIESERELKVLVITEQK
jgi:hypothetical protein